MRSTILFIAACFLAAASTAAAENCRDCHRVTLSGIHAKLACSSCHGGEINTIANPAAATAGGAGCSSCHTGYHRLFSHAMATRTAEKRFVAATYGKADPRFYEKNCQSCHVTSCGDCHGESGHAVAAPTEQGCFKCHRGYYVGKEYYGMAPREENLRYQRGQWAYGETFLKMLPDVHAEAGLTCGACHSMKSLAEGRTAAKTCTDCHTLDTGIIEHSIPAHRAKLECYACHSAWAPQEYGTFYLRFADTRSSGPFRLRGNRGEYAKSVYLKDQDAPPLGLNARGLVSPIRPQFIAYLSEIGKGYGRESENRLLAAQWKPFFPHTIRRGTVMCDGCHDTPRRFMLEPVDQRIYELQKDGMSLGSFWDRTGQTVIGGRFFPEARYRAISPRNPEYRRAYVKKWQQLLRHMDGNSPR